MFNFLNIFNSATDLLSVGPSAFNTYAHLRANKEQIGSHIKDLRYKAKKLELDVEFDQKMTREATREYANLSSYRLDEIRKDQLHDRQQLGFNIFNSGIDITSLDTAGLFMRFQAYDDEMKVKSIAAEMMYKRPQVRINPKAMNLAQAYSAEQISALKSDRPWEATRTLVSGISDIYEKLKGEERVK